MLPEFKKYLDNNLLVIKIGRLLYLFSIAIIITIATVADTDIISIYVSMFLNILLILTFILITTWRLNDIGWSKWWGLGILILSGMLYIDNDAILSIGLVISFVVIVVMSYVPGEDVIKKLEADKISSNIMLKNKIFNKKTTISFILGLAVMFGAYTVFINYAKNNNCLFDNVGVVEIFGDIDTFEDKDYISTSSLNIIQQIEELDANPDIKGIILDIASGGGVVEPSESIMLAVKRTSKPVVAVIRDMGASGAYLIATAADIIYANRTSDVGSIGVTMDFLDTSEQDRRAGVIFYNFSSGKYKGVLKEHNKITQEQRDEIMEDIMKDHDIFVEYVSENRNIPLEEVKLIATGESFLGEDALKIKLIDQIGGMQEAGVWMQEQVGEEISYCHMK
ncbi:MAG: signal peptide peptidase SppA [Candidatus Paceibacterota bacterium]|jgi:signal peptide peptidase SppA